MYNLYFHFILKNKIIIVAIYEFFFSNVKGFNKLNK